MVDLQWLVPCSFPIVSGWDLGRIDPVHPEHGVVPHFGYDFGCPIGTPLVAPCDGVVEHWWPIGSLAPKGFVSPRPLNGNCLIFRPLGVAPPGWAPFESWEILWLHLSGAEKHVGDIFARGEVIAHSGNTGYVYPIPDAAHPNAGAHLHDELHILNQPVDQNRVYGGRLRVTA